MEKYNESVLQRIQRERTAAMAEVFEAGKRAGKKEVKRSVEFWGYMAMSAVFLGFLFWLYILFA